MNLVDSSGWLEYFANDANAGHFAPAIERTADLVVPTVGLYEVFKAVLRQRGESEALNAVAVMHQGLIVELTAAIALAAARLSLELKLPLADSIILATARAHNATLWSQDEDFANIPGVRYFRKRTR